jgi:hypothetical protein
VHLPGMAFDNRPAGPGRSLRRLATRVAANRSGPSEPAPAVAVDDSAATTVPRVRPDPVLRWKDPSRAPDGDFASCALPNGQLRVHAIPERGDSWDAVSSFSLSYDGYAYWEDVSELATRCVRSWTRDHALPTSIDTIRACLFYEQRRWHHFGEDPNGRAADYVWALLDRLRTLVAARTPTAPPTSGTADTVVAYSATRPRPGAIRSFLDDDAGYLAWSSEHGDGFVVNADRTLSPNSLMLHRARCSCIGGPAGTGRTRTANYRKVCGADLDALVRWCRADIGVDPGLCRHCRPRSESSPSPEAAP